MNLNRNSNVNKKDAILMVVVGLTFVFLSIGSLFLIAFNVDGIVQAIVLMLGGATFGMAKTLTFDGIRYFTSK